jgi:hypothetical protein
VVPSDARLCTRQRKTVTNSRHLVAPDHESSIFVASWSVLPMR